MNGRTDGGGIRALAWAEGVGTSENREITEGRRRDERGGSNAVSQELSRTRGREAERKWSEARGRSRSEKERKREQSRGADRCAERRRRLSMSVRRSKWDDVTEKIEDVGWDVQESLICTMI